MATSLKNTNCFGNTQSTTSRGRCRSKLSVRARTFVPKNSSSWTQVKKKHPHHQRPKTAVGEVKKIKNTNPKARLCHFHFDPRKTCRKGEKCRFAHSRKEQEEAEKKFKDFIARRMKKAEEKDKKQASKTAAMVSEMAKRTAEKIKKMKSRYKFMPEEEFYSR